MRTLVCLLVAGLVSISGCSQESPTQPAPRGGTVVFSEDFSAAFPGSNWILTGGDSVRIDSDSGNPAPCVEIVVPSFGSGNPSLQTGVEPFDASGSGVDVTVDVAPGGNTASVRIYDRNNPSLATVALLSRSQGRYVVGGRQTANPQNSDDGFHTYQCTVSGGTVTWYRDGITQFTVDGFPGQALVVQLGVTTNVGVSRFDNVRVTRR